MTASTVALVASVLADSPRIDRGLALLLAFFLAGLIGKALQRGARTRGRPRRKRSFIVRTGGGFSSRMLVLALAALGLLTVGQYGAAIMAKVW